MFLNVSSRFIKPRVFRVSGGCETSADKSDLRFVDISADAERPEEGRRQLHLWTRSRPRDWRTAESEPSRTP